MPKGMTYENACYNKKGTENPVFRSPDQLLIVKWKELLPIDRVVRACVRAPRRVILT